MDKPCNINTHNNVEGCFRWFYNLLFPPVFPLGKEGFDLTWFLEFSIVIYGKLAEIVPSLDCNSLIGQGMTLANRSWEQEESNLPFLKPGIEATLWSNDEM